MKRNIFLLLFLLAVLGGTAAAQNQTRSRRVTSAEPAQSNASSPASNTVSTPDKPANHFAKRNPGSEEPSPVNSSAPPASQKSDPDKDVWGNSSIPNSIPAADRTRTLKSSETTASNGASPKKLIERTAMAIQAPTVRPTAPSSSNSVGTGVVRPTIARRPVSPTEEYRVGIGDVLDIRVQEMPTRESTLFTVLTNGLIEYPLLAAPVSVNGLTTDEIAGKLVGEIKVIENARLSVSVRDYASHAVVVTGWVDNPGRKMLRRESMPLYTVLAEALPRAEASFATIVRNQRAGQPLDIKNQKAMSTLLLPGDVVKISGNEAGPPRQFVYVGGQVAAPGEKDFRGGMTLTQTILAAGGIEPDAGKSVKVLRRNADGFLVASEYDMRAIQDGRSPDPLVQAGDRIEVGRALW